MGLARKVLLLPARPDSGIVGHGGGGGGESGRGRGTKGAAETGLESQKSNVM